MDIITNYRFCQSLVNNLNNLINELIKFSMPYKVKLIEFWEREADNGRVDSCEYYFKSEYGDFNNLFDISFYSAT